MPLGCDNRPLAVGGVLLCATALLQPTFKGDAGYLLPSNLSPVADHTQFISKVVDGSGFR